MSVAAVTVRLVDPDTLPDVAVIVVEPDATDVADPLEPAALLIVATPVLDELQVTDTVRFWVELSEYLPVAANCCLVPLPMLGFAGLIEMDTSVAGVTVRPADPDMLPDAAVTVVEPVATAATKPLEPAALLTVATPTLDELQVTAAVRFCVVLSEYVPVAANCWAVPLATLVLAGVTVMKTRIAGVTVNVDEPYTPPDVAVMVAEPTDTELAKPLEPAALLMDATDPDEELQVDLAVRSCVVLSEYNPVAINC
jgi:hypothetical protein